MFGSVTINDSKNGKKERKVRKKDCIEKTNNNIIPIML